MPPKSDSQECSRTRLSSMSLTFLELSTIIDLPPEKESRRDVSLWTSGDIGDTKLESDPFNGGRSNIMRNTRGFIWLK